MNYNSNKEYLKNIQYHTSDNLDARVALHERFTPKGNNIWDFVWSHYNIKRHNKVLEVGCGTGQFWNSSNRNDFRGFDVILSDFSNGMLNSARTNCSSIKHNFKFEIADVEKLQYNSHSFDIVLSHFMLYHTTSKNKAIDELKRVLKPMGWIGIVLISKGNMDNIFKPAYVIAPENKFPEPSSQLFSVDEAMALLQKEFNDIQKYKYEFTMQVDDIDLIVKYAQSSPVFRAFKHKDKFWIEYSKYIAKEINKTGYYPIKKGCIQFVCRNI
jgi:ubiquinone/menaquinone biosynthesis C-methylase UbiE